ncbi:MAG TPA: VOC family protein [Candidatus Paceibacterota bacterium]
MATTSIYLNFERETEAAFEFYKTVFGGEFIGGINRMGAVPPQEGQPELSEEDKNLVMHVALELPGGFQIMGTDAPESMGFTLNQGNNVYINVLPDTRTEADRLFAALSEGGVIEMPMQEMFWGDYFGSLTDKFGIRWMIDTAAKN